MERKPLKRKKPVEPEKEPKKFKKRTIFLNHLDIDVSNNVKEIYRSFSNSFLIRHKDEYYIHPIGDESIDLTEEHRPCIYGGHIGKINLKPLGPCLNCESVIDEKRGRVPLVKKYDYHYKRFTIWGNFCDFPCALRYELDHPNHNTNIVIVWLNKLAREYWGYEGIIHPAPPRLFYEKYGGNIDPQATKDFSKEYIIKVRENFASIPIVGEYLSTEPSSMENWNMRKIHGPRSKKVQGPELPLNVPAEKEGTVSTEKAESLYEKFLRENPERPVNLILPINSSTKKKKKTTEPKKKKVVEPKPPKKEKEPTRKKQANKSTSSSSKQTLPANESLPLPMTNNTSPENIIAPAVAVAATTAAISATAVTPMIPIRQTKSFKQFLKPSTIQLTPHHQSQLAENKP